MADGISQNTAVVLELIPNHRNRRHLSWVSEEWWPYVVECDDGFLSPESLEDQSEPWTSSRNSNVSRKIIEIDQVWCVKSYSHKDIF